MTRQEIENDIISIKSNYILCELPTGVGKSKIALRLIDKHKLKGNILIVIPRLVLINNWKDEIEKWGYKEYLDRITFTTYISLHKHVDKKFDLVIFDECHHLSERAREFAECLSSKYYILLSATVTKTLKKEIKLIFPKIECYKISMREIIEEDILPDPKVFLIPLKLRNDISTEVLTINPGAKGQAYKIDFKQRFAAKKDRNHKFVAQCTQEEYHRELCSMIDFYKRAFLRSNNQMIYFRWQQKAKERLVWLSGLKNNIVSAILKRLENKRTLTFCNSIEQTEQLGKYCINSKNTESDKYLAAFNAGEINHITACNMLNEGVNLDSCQVGIFVSINSSEVMTIQKIGRILRHPDPMIIILYYKDTREEEIVTKMIENYNPDLITIVNKYIG